MGENFRGYCELMPYLVEQVGISLEIIENGTLIAENIFEKSCRKIWR